MKKIWIIGAGSIAKEYAKVLNSMGCEYTVIGRGLDSARIFKEVTGKEVITGGLTQYLNTSPEIAGMAIVTTKVSELSAVTIELMNYGVKKIFCEKPGFLYPEQCDEVLNISKQTNSKVYIAYNRRFFSSVLKTQEIIEEDGGVTSFNFEFTEWSHIIGNLPYGKHLLAQNFYGNTTHVIDLAFFICGKPTQLSCLTAGELSWHKPAIFVGSGVTDKGALFCYQANWAAPGRWGVEILTSKHRLYLRPMEQLQIQNIGSIAINPVEIDDNLDKEFKPGFYLETQAFLEGNYSRLCSIEEQCDNVSRIYKKIRNSK